jgi:hypothetical protein
MALADEQDRILISADTDFGELLAKAPVLAPSVILLRRADKRPVSVAEVIVANLGQVAGDLAAGALVVMVSAGSGCAGCRCTRMAEMTGPLAWLVTTPVRTQMAAGVWCYRAAPAMKAATM